MIFLTFHRDDTLALGVKRGDEVIDLSRAVEQREPLAEGVPSNAEALFVRGLGVLATIERFLEAIEEAGRDGEYVHDEQVLKLGPPVPAPGKIVCVGRNYRKHAEEMNAEVPAEPLLFGKFSNAIAASGEAIDISGLEQVDYEAELAVVIGKRAKRVTAVEALGHVFGYTNANDLSERALQYRTSQFLIGKSLDGFLPIGPYLVTADEIGDPGDLSVRGWLNGELRQESHTSKMVFPVAEIVSHVSCFMTLEPGDLLLTGTPEGVIKGRTDREWIRAGDEYVVEVGPLGRLVTRFVSG